MLLERHSGWHRDALNGRTEALGQHLSSESALFSLKPDFDVFGIPERTRKQRGWYQIHRGPKTKSHTTSPLSYVATAATRPTYAKSTDLPLETIDMILYHSSVVKMVSKGATGARFVLVWMPEQAANVSLVSRRFTYTFQGLAFLQIRLRSFSDFQTYRTMVEDKNGYAARSTMDLKVYHDPSSAPWLHNLYALTNWRKTLSIVLYLGSAKAGPESRSGHVSSIFAHIPRRMPATFCARIYRLCITNVSFHNFGELVRLVWDLGELEKLSSSNLTFKCEPEVPQYPRRVPRRTTHLHTFRDYPHPDFNCKSCNVATETRDFESDQPWISVWLGLLEEYHFWGSTFAESDWIWFGELARAIKLPRVVVSVGRHSSCNTGCHAIMRKSNPKPFL